MINGQALVYNPKEGDIQVISKDIYLGLIQSSLRIEQSVYRSKSYAEIIKDINKKNPKALKVLAPKMYCFTDKYKNVVVCLIDKTLDDFKKYCKKNKLKLIDNTSSTISPTTLSVDKIKEIVHNLTECFINDQYPDNRIAGIKKEIDVHKYSYAGVIQDSIIAQYNVKISLNVLKSYLKEEFQKMLKKECSNMTSKETTCEHWDGDDGRCTYDGTYHNCEGMKDVGCPLNKANKTKEVKNNIQLNKWYSLSELSYRYIDNKHLLEVQELVNNMYSCFLRAWNENKSLSEVDSIYRNGDIDFFKGKGLKEFYTAKDMKEAQNIALIYLTGKVVRMEVGYEVDDKYLNRSKWGIVNYQAYPQMDGSTVIDYIEFKDEASKNVWIKAESEPVTKLTKLQEKVRMYILDDTNRKEKFSDIEILNEDDNDKANNIVKEEVSKWSDLKCKKFIHDVIEGDADVVMYGWDVEDVKPVGKSSVNLQKLNWDKMKKRMIAAGWDNSGPFGEDKVDYDNGTYQVKVTSQSGWMKIAVNKQGQVYYEHHWDEDTPKHYTHLFDNAEDCLKWCDKHGYLYVM